MSKSKRKSVPKTPPLERTLAQAGLAFELYALAWGQQVPCRLVDGEVFFLGGPVSKRVPLVLRYRGKVQDANRLIRHLRGRKKGFKQITVLPTDELVGVPTILTEPPVSQPQPAEGLFRGIE